MQNFVYGLVDPVTAELRYVGLTTHGMKRPLGKHLGHCLNWELALESAGLQKQVVVLELCPPGIDPLPWLQETEKFYIGLYRCLGANLTNIADGGTGGPTRRGRKNSQKQIDALVTSRKGRPLSVEHKRKISEKMKGRKLSSSHREAIGQALVGHTQSEEARKHSQAGILEYWQSNDSLEHRKTLSDRMRRIRNGR